jgi:hypothetical protein
MPVVRLRNKQTGQEAYFINIHNPADTKKHHNQEKYRDAATAIEIALINKLQATGVPVIITGDANEREEFYNKVTQGAHMTASNADSKGKVKNIGIDWILGTKGVSFSGHTKDRGAFVQQTTDHPVITSNVHIAGRTK